MTVWIVTAHPFPLHSLQPELGPLPVTWPYLQLLVMQRTQLPNEALVVLQRLSLFLAHGSIELLLLNVLSRKKQITVTTSLEGFPNPNKYLYIVVQGCGVCCLGLVLFPL